MLKLEHDVYYYYRYKTAGKKIKERECWTLNGKRHREDGPAYIYYYKDGSIWCERYYINGLYHREGGPAAIWYNSDGSIECEQYYLNGERHREDGVAGIVYDKNGSVLHEYYHLNNVRYSQKKWFKQLSKEQKIAYLLKV